MALSTSLYGSIPYGNSNLLIKQKYIKIFDKDHNVLDEIDEYSALTYTWTLNGLGKCEFDFPLESLKCTETNFKFRNHIEIWDNISNTCLWGGQIVGRQFQGPKIHISCYGYLSLLSWRRLIYRNYSEMTYGNLLSTMITNTNSIAPTGVSIGNIQGGSLKTQRLVENQDFLLDKIQNFIEDCNNDIEVDINRNFNFYLKKGSIKPYILEYGGDADNILLDPTLGQDVIDMANSVYAESNSLSSVFSDSTSIALYGLVDGVCSASNDITTQSTLNNYCSGYLQRRAYPSNNISLQVKNSSLCPFDDIKVGDSVTVNLKPYWNFTDVLRILEMTHNEEDGTRNIIVGQTLYRPQKPSKKMYIK